jgi:hypothetical protein
MTETTALEQELIRLETRFWDAMQRRDTETVAELTAVGSVVVGASGAMALGPRSLARMLGSAEWDILGYELDRSTATVQRLSDDTALIAYHVHEDLRVGDEELGLDAFDASVWQRRNGHWTCVLHTESIAGDPFGRDRVAGTAAQHRVGVAA